MRVLIACEYSGTVRAAFAALPHVTNATRCDLLPTDRPLELANEYHHTGCIFELLASDPQWDLMIAHPPCTYLAASGARWWVGRQQEQRQAIDFVMRLATLDIPRIAIENPVGRLSTVWRKPDQYIQPWEHGHGETKKTGLWVKGLPPLTPSDIVDGREARIHTMSPGPDRWKRRSTTLPGIAAAMASQWGCTS